MYDTKTDLSRLFFNNQFFYQSLCTQVLDAYTFGQVVVD